MTFITPQRFETSQRGDGSPSKRGTFGTKPRSACLPNFYGVQLFLTSIIFATASVSFKMAMACHGYGWLGSLGAIARLLPRTQASLAMSAGPMLPWKHQEAWTFNRKIICGQISQPFWIQCIRSRLFHDFSDRR